MQSEYRVQEGHLEGEKSAENVISVLVENIIINFFFFFFSLEIFSGALDSVFRVSD